MLSRIFTVLADWNNSLWVDMLLHSDILSWFLTNQSLLLFLNAECLAEKQKITKKPPSTTFELYAWKICPNVGHAILFLVLISTFNFQQFVTRIEEHFLDWPWSFIYRLGSMKFVIFEENCFVHFLQVSYFKTMSCFDCTIDTNFVRKKKWQHHYISNFASASRSQNTFLMFFSYT
jgi:hypothetical protein